MDLHDIKKALNAGAISSVSELTKKAIEEGLPVREILDALIGGMDEIGVKFRSNEIFIPEVLISAKAMHAGLDVLEPHLSKSGIKPVAKVVLGTVKGDLHDIGKNLVSMMLRGAGFEVIDLGIDVPAERFVEEAGKEEVRIVAMSCLVTTSMNSMKVVIEAIKGAGLSGKVKTMVGGAPITEGFAGSIGADGYADEASSAVEKARELIGLRVGG